MKMFFNSYLFIYKQPEEGTISQLDYKEESKGDIDKPRLVPTNYELELLNLHEGFNGVYFRIDNCTQQVKGRIFFWEWRSQIVICDIDGTITKSDVGGNIMPLFGNDWIHTGIAKLLSEIHKNGYMIIYLSARSIDMSQWTTKYLQRINEETYKLPIGPLIMSPDGVVAALTREIIMRKPQQFKIPALLDIQKLFPKGHSPFYAAYGNRNTDIIAYVAAGIKVDNVYIVDESGAVTCKSEPGSTTYTKIANDVDRMFPKLTNSLNFT